MDLDVQDVSATTMASMLAAMDSKEERVSVSALGGVNVMKRPGVGWSVKVGESSDGVERELTEDALRDMCKLVRVPFRLASESPMDLAQMLMDYCVEDAQNQGGFCGWTFVFESGGPCVAVHRSDSSHLTHGAVAGNLAALASTWGVIQTIGLGSRAVGIVLELRGEARGSLRDYPQSSVAFLLRYSPYGWGPTVVDVGAYRRSDDFSGFITFFSSGGKDLFRAKPVEMRYFDLKGVISGVSARLDCLEGDMSSEACENMGRGEVMSLARRFHEVRWVSTAFAKKFYKQLELRDKECGFEQAVYGADQIHSMAGRVVQSMNIDQQIKHLLYLSGVWGKDLCVEEVELQ